jgi:predicted amidophosphoribosyltransferase
MTDYNCPYCNTPIDEQDLICPNCHKFIPEENNKKAYICPICGKENQAGAKSCAFCCSIIPTK